KLFSFIGDIAKLDVHPSSVSADVQEAQIEFSDAASVRAALFLTGTELAERALVVAEDNQKNGLIMGGGGGGGGGAHAMPLANAPVVAMMARRPRTAAAAAIPANVAALIHPSVLQFDPIKAEEISRTIYVGNIASWVGEQQLMDFFSASGPVAYVKMAGDGMQPTRFAFVEFADVQTAQNALQMNGMMLADRPLKVNHSKNAINKPQQRSAVPSVGAVGPLMAPVPPSVPTLAAIASLPSNVDPVAATLLGSTVQARLQAARQQGSSGLAWPVLGTVNPTATMSAQGDELDISKKIRDLQVQMEAKYGHTRGRGAAAAHRSRSRESSESRRRRRHRRDDESRSSRRHRRSPSVSERSSRRRRDDSPRSYRDGRR
ncbi:hypothetical protein GGI23_007627, partial [Coemansia sp. RSA 2559]